MFLPFISNDMLTFEDASGCRRSYHVNNVQCLPQTGFYVASLEGDSNILIKSSEDQVRHAFQLIKQHRMPCPSLDMRPAYDGIVLIDYTNWEGKREVRTIFPLSLHFGSNVWHPEPQWLLEAFDLNISKPRSFAISGINNRQDVKLDFRRE
jgi:hypothetical protein